MQRNREHGRKCESVGGLRRGSEMTAAPAHLRLPRKLGHAAGSLQHPLPPAASPGQEEERQAGLKASKKALLHPCRYFSQVSFLAFLCRCWCSLAAQAVAWSFTCRCRAGCAITPDRGPHPGCNAPAADAAWCNISGRLTRRGLEEKASWDRGWKHATSSIKRKSSYTKSSPAMLRE